MRKLSRQVLAMLCVAALLLGGILPGAGIMTASAAGEHTLWLVGDSTVCSFSDAYYYPRYGYGTQIGNYLTADWAVQNLALSGRSSKSFLVEDNYRTLQAGIKAGDVLIIGFGHNDEKSEEARYTNPNGDYQTAGSFAESLYTNYVKLAQDAGAEAILCTPIVRRNSSDTLSNSNCHITTDAVVSGVTYPGGDYAQAIRDLGAATNTPVVDMTALTKTLYESIGAAETLKLHAWTGMKETSVDNTHLNIYGAKKIAYMLASDVKTQGITALAAGIDLSKGEPTEADRVPNPDYKEPTYTSDLPRSAYFAPYKLTQGDRTLTFKGSYFGTIGGVSKVSEATIETDADGNMHIVAGSGSKIASANDGFAVYYYRLPAGVPFTFSATAKLNSELDNTQKAYGLMVRDDMYIDTHDSSILSDYVAAGVLGSASNACFRRQSNALTKGPAMTKPEVGSSLDLSISYNGDGFACTVGSEPTQTGGYDYQLTSVDPDYVYLCLFAVRSTDVTFSNIKLEVEGGIPEEEPEPTYVYLAGDSTVKDYSATGMNVSSDDKAKGGEALGSWGEFLQTFFNKKAVSVTSYAHGGRSSRSFLNEGRLDSLGKSIAEGDYLFIQFGHNDASDDADNKAERYVPLGTPDANGIYPSTPGVKGADGTYAWDCGGTYKWFLQQYIDLAKEKGATPILVTPVARMYYTADGSIRPHHDAESTAEAEMTNSYVTAVKQLAQEQNVLLIDGFELTKTLFEDAYKAGGSDTNGKQLMGVKTTEAGTETDTTHNNKLGGMIEAALMAGAIKDLGLDISKEVQAPTAVTGSTPDGKTAFTVSDAGVFTAYDSLSDYANEAAYWSQVGQKLLDNLSGSGDVPSGDGSITAGGWLETAYAELKGVKAADVTAVRYTGAMTGALSENDLAYLVRDVDGVTRIDIPGLKAGTYDLTVTAGGKDYTATGVKVLAHDRSGFAHYNYTEGVGAYNDDGTLKENAVVLYVTEANKDTVSLTVGDKTVTGIGNILNSKGYKQNGNNKILLDMSRANIPLVVRIVGDVTAPAGVSAKASNDFGGSTKDNGSMCTIQHMKDLTIEGIGVGATVNGWGFTFDGGAQTDGSWGKNFEVRNVTFRNVPEDCVGIQGEVKNGELAEPAQHIWVHNCEFYVPSIENPAEADKAQGDGAVDFKCAQYMTMSYNYFEGYHKTSLIGGSDTDPQYHVTWHHNYWKDVQSRSPLARQADVHIYNNLYEGQTSYCMSLRANTYIFSEYNTFINCKDVAIDEGTGGVCKSYMDTIVDCTGRDASIKVTDKTQTVESANKFANFDTDSESYVAKGAYLLDTSVEAAQANIKAYGGTMKAAPAADEPSGELAGTVIILHSNDVHGAVEGYAKMDTLKKEYEAKGADVLVVDAGDFSQGETSVSVSQGATAIELMNMVGYDAAAPGNHEFDYGYANLKALAEQAAFPILAANVTYNDANALGDHVVLTTASGVKIGFFGLDTPETASKAHPAKIAGVKFAGGEEMYAVAQAEVDALKAAGADYIICLGHLGIDNETAATANRSIDLLAKVTGIDVFVDGHSHSTLEQIAAVTNPERKVGDTVVTSTGTKFANIGVITIKDGAVTTECVSTEGITVAEDNAIAARAAAIRAEIDAEYGAVFAKSEVDLNGEKAPGNRTQETNNGDLITDAILWLATKEELSVPKENVIALTNGGGIRAAIAAGDVTKKDVNTVLPFGNTVAVDYVTGKVLLEALEASTFCTPEAIGGFPQVAGIKFTVDTTKTYDQGDLYPGTTYYAPKTINRVTIDSVNGKAFDENATYAVVTNDFVAAGGDTYYALSVSETITDTGVPLDEAVMQYITEELGGVIPAAKYAEPQGRITIKTEADEPSQPVHRPSSSRGERGETTTPVEGENKVTKTNKDGSVTVTVTAANGEKLVNITLPAAIPAPETKFVDVPEGHWAETAINNMAGLGVVNGVGEGAYDMVSSVTRGSIATILFRFGGGAEGKTSTFADVAAGQWYTDAIGWAASTGVVTGYSATEFGPNDTITRQQLAVMLARFAKLIGMDTTADKTALNSFTDGSQVAGWAEDGMAWCVEEKVLQGRSAEILDPTAQVTRAEAAVMFDRFIALIK